MLKGELWVDWLVEVLEMIWKVSVPWPLRSGIWMYGLCDGRKVGSESARAYDASPSTRMVVCELVK